MILCVFCVRAKQPCSLGASWAMAVQRFPFVWLLSAPLAFLGCFCLSSLPVTKTRAPDTILTPKRHRGAALQQKKKIMAGQIHAERYDSSFSVFDDSVPP